METVLIIGGNGQLGRCLAEQLSGSYSTKSLGRSELDLTEVSVLRRYLTEGSYRAIVNCAAYTGVDQAESEESLAYAVNATAVGDIAAICQEFAIPLIHISTDYVYDNGLKRPLRESDPLQPKSVYGKSKLAGERAALIACKRTFVLRTSWVYSEYGKNFLLTMLRLADKGIDPKVVSDQRGCPTYARDLAIGINRVVDQVETSAPGIYNFCNAGETTWNKFAEKIFELAGRETEVTPITTKDFGAAASRPQYSVLDTSTFTSTFGIRPRPWHKALADCIGRLSEPA